MNAFYLKVFPMMLCLLAGFAKAGVQCTSQAGSMDPALISQCGNLPVTALYDNSGEVLDTAFKVVIEDVLSPYLDVTTLRPGASSHDYELEIHGSDTLVFIFENIVLPDSNVNEHASHGLVKFRIGQLPFMPLGTVIENSAAIFFDFNDPVITNTTYHKLGENFILTPVWDPPSLAFHWAVFPNPFSEAATFVVEGAASGKVSVRLYDLTGRLVRKEMASGNMLTMYKGSLPAGLYLFEIEREGMPPGKGKLILR
jgi:hypothetical protein